MRTAAHLAVLPTCVVGFRPLPKRTRGRTHSRGASFIALLLFALSTLAQSPPLIRKRVGEVRLTLVATDRNERPLSRLSPTDIKVLDNGLPVSSFDLRPAVDFPLQVALVLDLSGSTQKSWALVHDALIDSFHQSLRPGDQLLVLGFSNKIETERAVADPVQLDEALQPRRAGGLTAMYDALYYACNHSMFRGGIEAQRRALILFSDGEDNLSIHGLSETIARAELNGLFIYTIATHGPRQRREGDVVLSTLAAATGGRDFVVQNTDQLKHALATINGELRSSFLLFYRSPDDSVAGNFRRVSIVPVQKNGLSVRSRQGYFTAP
ncbi:MAG TPA: VWA domain-containing protein [Terriglobia bacterium]|nr:VWA domain-containing protein [Terriglobia bacterium]